MSSGYWRQALSGDARLAELAAIEEREFQVRLKARRERERTNADLVGGRSDEATAAPSHLQGDVADSSDQQAVKALIDNRDEVQQTAKKNREQIVDPRQKPAVTRGPLNSIPKLSPISAGPLHDRQAAKSTAEPLHTTAAPENSKRPSPASIFSDERRQSLTKRPKSSSIASATTPITEENGPLEIAPRAVMSGERPPKWYRDLKRDKTRSRGDSNVDVLLVTLREWIKKAQKPSQSKAEVFTEVRARIHKIAFLPATAKLLKNNWMLDNQDGLPLIFDSTYNAGVAWPWDVKADAEELYNKWCRGIFETDLMRGIVFQKFGNNKRDSERLDPNYKGRVPAGYHGNGDLLNGQWWPTRLAALRDGAHGETQAGISGAEGKGAFACVMSGGLDKDGNEYPDVDQGDWILYCGTDNTGDDRKPTSATQRMIESIGKEPVRLIRSSDVRSAFAPQIGYRYDGLYKVVSAERLDSAGSARQRHRFRLERIPGQDPLRGGSGPEKRPTAEEVEEYQKMQKGIRGNIPI